MNTREWGPDKLLRVMLDGWGVSDEQRAAILSRYKDGADNQRAILRMGASLHNLYRSDKQVQSWLCEPQKDLGGKTPLQSMTGDDHPLKVVQYVDHLSGR
jgi:hypothetical protein